MDNHANQIELLPLTHPQKGIWYTESLYPNSRINSIAGTLKIRSDLNSALMEKAYNLLIKTSDAFRIRIIHTENGPGQYISNYEYEKLDIFDFSKKGQEEFFKFESELTSTPFTLESSRLYYFALIKTNDDECGLYIKLHHAISDAWSIVQAANCLMEYYYKLSDDVNFAPENNNSYVDYIEYEKEYKKSDRFDKDRQFWLETFESQPEHTGLKVRKSNRKSIDASRVSFALPPKLCNKIKEYCSETKSSIFGIFLAALAIYINRVTDKRTLVFGIPVLNRSNAKQKSTAGMFISTVPIKIEFEEDISYKEFFEKISLQWLRVLKHQRYPYDLLLEELRRKFGSTENLFDIVLSYQNVKIVQDYQDKRTARWHFSGQQVEQLYIHINDRENDGNIILNYDYLKDLFYKKEIEFVHDHLIRILWHAIDNPSRKVSEIEMISEKEKNKIIHVFNKTETDYPYTTIHQLFEEQVRKTPDRTALIFENKELTFFELNRRANILAAVLREKGVKPDDVVGIMVRRSLEMIIGILGILKAGGAYLPIDPNYPPERIEYMLQNSNAKILLTKRSNIIKANSNCDTLDIFSKDLYQDPGDNLINVNKPSDLINIIYTSGSTGMPKGVMIEHRNMSNMIKGITDKIDYDINKTIISVTTISFDIFAAETLLPLTRGMKVVIANEQEQNFPKDFSEAISRNNVDIVQTTPSRMQILISDNGYLEPFKNLTDIILAGEAFPRNLYIKLRQISDAEIYNLYGPTETTVYSTLKKLENADDINIGSPIANTQCYILDSNKKSVPISTRGELYIGGEGLARGYLNRPDLTEERFVTNPLNENEKIYKTGDLARWYPRGEIEYLGRIDFQVKIRGIRIELGEIENSLLTYDGIEKALVIAIEEENGKQYLCAYIQTSKEFKNFELKRYLSKRLPEAMIPSYYVFMDKLPLTPNGKIDRRALPKPDTSSNLNQGYDAPANETEAALSNIWSEVLNEAQVGVNHSFGDLGVDSLDAIKIITKIHKAFNVQLTMDSIYEMQTIRTISDYISRAQRSRFAPIEKVPQSAHYKLSPAQKRQFIMNRMDGPGVNYNMPGIAHVYGSLDKERLENSFKEIINRHEVLRTSFELLDGEPVQIIHEHVEFGIEFFESNADRDSIIKGFFKPFDLGNAPLIRVGLIKTTDAEHLLLFDMHHIISDGESIRILINEFTELYSGEVLEPLNIQYKDFSEWISTVLSSSIMKKQREYWVNTFSDDIPILNLPTDYSRQSKQSFRGDRISVKIGKSLSSKLRKLSSDTNTTLFMILMAAYNILLSKYSGQEDIVTGIPVEGRRHADLQGLIGMFVNTLPLRLQPSGNKSFLQFLNEVKYNSLKAFENQEYPFEDLVSQLNINRDMGRSPLFDTMFVLQKNDLTEFKAGNTIFRQESFNNNTSKFDITLEVTQHNDKLICSFEYCTDLFRRTTITRMTRHYVNLLKDIVNSPESVLSDLRMLSGKEVNRLLYDFNDTDAEYPKDKTIHVMFEEQVLRTPDKTALVFENVSMSYKELNGRANSLAKLLRNKGVKPDQIIGLLARQSIEMVVGILGILKAGGAYLPIDPDYPAERIKYMLEDSEVKLLLTHEGLDSSISGANNTIDLIDLCKFTEVSSNLENVNKQNDLAYVIYTSGSTGKPKGVMIEHKSLINLCCWHNQVFEVTDKERTTKYAGEGFDASVWEIFPYIITGATIYILNKETKIDLMVLNQYYQENSITISFLPTPVCEQFLKLKNNSLTRLLTGGDKLKYFINKSYKLYNNYGPTENTVVTTCFQVRRNTPNIPIGKPINNTKIFIVDKYLNLLPEGVIGELYISGDSLSRGYINNSGVTLSNFVDNKYLPGQKMYRTGDLAKWNRKGEIVFMGRNDNQIKIRGLRIELSEIESRILEAKSVTDAAVLLKEAPGGSKCLCAYIVSEDEVDHICEYLKRYLPDYMVPEYFIKVKSIPITPNGKVDKNKLPEPEFKAQSEELNTIPENILENKISEIFSSVLGRDKIGVNDDLFKLGGDSLTVIQILTLASKSNLKIDFKDIYEQKTIRNIAKKMQEENDIINITS
ncbi:MAG: amino acid adenylation domain-containing protein [Eubacteriales bacterium]|nr:amino acid adenylation domain-containing protein [Eubacteriales bacterium]